MSHLSPYRGRCLLRRFVGLSAPSRPISFCAAEGRTRSNRSWGYAEPFSPPTVFIHRADKPKFSVDLGAKSIVCAPLWQRALTFACLGVESGQLRSEQAQDDPLSLRWAAKRTIYCIFTPHTGWGPTNRALFRGDHFPDSHGIPASFFHLSDPHSS